MFAQSRSYPCWEHGRTEPGARSESRPEPSVVEQYFRMTLAQKYKGRNVGNLDETYEISLSSLW